MPHIKAYIEQSILIPPNLKESLLKEEIYEVVRDDIGGFIEIYTPLEQEIMNQINKELELLNIQVKKHLENTETILKEQEIKNMEQEIAYL